MTARSDQNACAMPRRETKVARWFGTSDVVTEAVTEPLFQTGSRIPPVSSAQSLAELIPGAVIENRPITVPAISGALPPSTRWAHAAVPPSHLPGAKG